jgi:hypothetical protein
VGTPALTATFTEEDTMTLSQLVNKGFRFVGDSIRFSSRLAQGIGGPIVGLARGGGRPKARMDDVTLARKVETELFRDAGSPKGKVNINAVDGVVELRGQVKRPADIRKLEAKARKIPEVRDVRNLLHLPKTPSPTRTDSPRPHRARAETRRAGNGAGHVQTAERTTVEAEEAPIERAARDEGRDSAPLGGEGGDSAPPGGEG